MELFIQLLLGLGAAYLSFRLVRRIKKGNANEQNNRNHRHGSNGKRNSKGRR